MMTNIGEYIAGAYYSVVERMSTVKYNQTINFDEARIGAIEDELSRELLWNKQKILEVLKKFNISNFRFELTEIDVVATDTVRFIAECSERNPENRTIEQFKKKFIGAIIYDQLNGQDLNLRLELWAPTVSGKLARRINELSKELEIIHKEFSGEDNMGTFQFDLIHGVKYKDRMKEIIDSMKDRNRNYLDNPFLRSIQLLIKSEIL